MVPTPVPANDITDNDVLFGRGRVIHLHEGNIRFRKLVKERCFDSSSSGGDRVRESAFAIIATIRSRNGRFLKPIQGSSLSAASNTWQEVGLVATLDKVRQALRDAKSKSKTASRDHAAPALVNLLSPPFLPRSAPTTATQMTLAEPFDFGLRDDSSRPSALLEERQCVFPQRQREERRQQEELLQRLTRLRAHYAARRLELLRAEEHILLQSSRASLPPVVDRRLPLLASSRLRHPQSPTTRVNNSLEGLQASFLQDTPAELLREDRNHLTRSAAGTGVLLLEPAPASTRNTSDQHWPYDCLDV